MLNVLRHIVARPQPKSPVLMEGYTYLTRENRFVTIAKRLTLTDHGFFQGYAFADTRGNTYTEDGRFHARAGYKDRRDIVALAA